MKSVSHNNANVDIRAIRFLYILKAKGAKISSYLLRQYINE